MSPPDDAYHMVSNVLRGAGGVMVVGGTAAAVFAVVRDVRHALHKRWTRYTGELELDLRSIFNFTSGNDIAIVQVCAVGAVAALGLMMQSLPTVILMAIIVVGPTVVIRQMRKGRLAQLEAQVPTFV